MAPSAFFGGNKRHQRRLGRQQQTTTRTQKKKKGGTGYGRRDREIQNGGDCLAIFNCKRIECSAKMPRKGRCLHNSFLSVHPGMVAPRKLLCCRTADFGISGPAAQSRRVVRDASVLSPVVVVVVVRMLDETPNMSSPSRARRREKARQRSNKRLGLATLGNTAISQTPCLPQLGEKSSFFSPIAVTSSSKCGPTERTTVKQKRGVVFVFVNDRAAASGATPTLQFYSMR